MARSLSLTRTLSRHLRTTSYSRLIALRAQSTTSSDSVDPLILKLEDAIHTIIVRKSAPDWLPFSPGSSYWVPPPRSRSSLGGLAQLVHSLANPLTDEESLSTTTVRGWPSSSFFIPGPAPATGASSYVPVSRNNVGQKKVDNVEQKLDSSDNKPDSATNTEEEEG